MADPDVPPPAACRVVRDAEFTGETVVLDYHAYINCKFTDCRVVYGGGLTYMKGCHHKHCSYNFVDAAGRAVVLMRSLDPRLSPSIDEHGNIVFRGPP